MKYEDMRRMEKTHCCAQCGGGLVTRTNPEGPGHVLVCSQDNDHSDYKAIMSPSQLVSRGQGDETLGKGAQKDLEKLAKEQPQRFALIPKADLGSNRALTKEDVVALAKWADTFNLNLSIGHVCLYYGKPYVSIDGYYYLRHKRNLPWVVGSRPLSDEERKQYQLNDGDHGWIAHAYIKGREIETVGIGIVTQDEIEGKSQRDPEQYRAPVVHRHPQRMAEKRAEWQLLRKLVPLEEIA